MFVLRGVSDFGVNQYNPEFDTLDEALSCARECDDMGLALPIEIRDTITGVTYRFKDAHAGGWK